MRQISANGMKQIKSRSFVGVLLVSLCCAGCGKDGSGLTPANYDQVTTGMNKAQVEKILGPPTKQESKQSLIFGSGQSRWQPVTTYRYQEGEKFIEITFKDDKVDKKDSNLGREP